MEAIIEGYKRFEIHDGPGVRTTVFLKGCPLRCKWCHNPECLELTPELGFSRNLCISCGECTKACPMGCHTLKDGIHEFNRSRCVSCGLCSEGCLGSALRIHGQKENVEQVVKNLLEDKVFYGNKGGVTISGGEPLMQSEFTTALLKTLKQERIHTALDTCLYSSRKTLNEVLPFTDLFLVDIKAIDEAVHIRATGVSNQLILDNIRFLDSVDAQMEVRIPFVPGYNDDQMEKIAQFTSTLKHVSGVRLLPYHNIANSKYAELDRAFELIRLPQKEELEHTEDVFRKHGIMLME